MGLTDIDHGAALDPDHRHGAVRFDETDLPATGTEHGVPCQTVVDHLAIDHDTVTNLVPPDLSKPSPEQFVAV